jgi:hypothetical protein
MPATRWILLVAVTGLASACTDGSMTAVDLTVQPGVWGSDQASLTVSDSGSTLEIVTSTGCVGSYGEIDQSIPAGQFSRPGVYTQLIGAFPGKLDYAAEYSGVVEGNQMSIMVSVPALQQTMGPFTLTQGLDKTWDLCLYP